jgi:5-methylcytosine-specific restriction endonuclease McrA
MSNRYPINLITSEGRQRFYNTREWRSLRLIILTEQIWCQECLKEERYEASTEVDHIIDIVDDPTLFFTKGNLQGLCKSHHSQKTFHKNDKGRFGNINKFEVVNLKWKNLKIN